MRHEKVHTTTSEKTSSNAEVTTSKWRRRSHRTTHHRLQRKSEPHRHKAWLHRILGMTYYTSERKEEQNRRVRSPRYQAQLFQAVPAGRVAQGPRRWPEVGMTYWCHSPDHRLPCQSCHVGVARWSWPVLAAESSAVLRGGVNVPVACTLG